MKQLGTAIAIILLTTACGSAGDDAVDATTTTTTSAAPAAATREPASTTTTAAATTTTTEPPCGTGGDLALGQQNRTITTSDGLEREFLLFLPESYKEGTPADIVFNFHGSGSNAIEQYLYGYFVPLAEEDNVILVNPQALASGKGEPVQWTGRVGTDDDRTLEPADDIDFVAELIDLVRSEYCVGDLYAAGMSSGGFMSTALGCWEDSPFAGIAPVTLAVHAPGCETAPPATFVYFHGTNDEVVSFDGNGGRLASAPETAQDWADHNACDPEPAEDRVSDEVIHFSWSGCDASTDFYVIENGGHTWPGSVEVPGLGYVTRDISATEIIWEAFFD